MSKIHTLSVLCILSALITFSALSRAELADGRFGSAQVFDVQRNPAFPAANQPFTVSSFSQPFSDISGAQYTITAGQYIRFFKVSDAPCRYGINLFNSNNTLNRVIAASGVVYGLGAEGFLHTSLPSDFGTFVSNGTGYALGSSLTYLPAVGQATCAQTAAYNPSTTPTDTPGPIAPAAPATVASIPTLSEWGIVLTGGLVAVATFVTRRRRKTVRAV